MEMLTFMEFLYIWGLCYRIVVIKLKCIQLRYVQCNKSDATVMMIIMMIIIIILLLLSSVVTVVTAAAAAAAAAAAVIAATAAAAAIAVIVIIIVTIIYFCFRMQPMVSYGVSVDSVCVYFVKKGKMKCLK